MIENYAASGVRPQTSKEQRDQRRDRWMSTEHNHAFWDNFRDEGFDGFANGDHVRRFHEAGVAVGQRDTRREKDINHGAAA